MSMPPYVYVFYSFWNTMFLYFAMLVVSIVCDVYCLGYLCYVMSMVWDVYGL
jgi:hypothetical protein